MRIAGRIFFVLLLCALILWFKPLTFFVPRDLLVNRAGFSQAVYSADGTLLRFTLSSDDKFRIWTPLAKISPAMIHATLAQEDRWFYYHPGINPISMIRATILTYIHSARTGGSTITMQLARLRYGLYTRSIFGKFRQIFAALVIESFFTKDQILEAYLNLAPYGQNIEGVGAAARIYFNKKSQNLSDAEAVTLSVIPQYPSRRIPIATKDASVQSLETARERLLKRLPSSSGETPISVLATHTRKDLPFEAPHFVERMIKTYPLEPEIKTTLDHGIQARLERQIQRYVEKNDKLGIRNASAMLVDWQTMEVKGYVGSADYFDASINGFVDGIQARRSPGSALKPFVYALGLEKGKIHPGSILKDTSFTRSNYNPENFERDFVGPISATDALIRSRNIPAVSLLNYLTPQLFYQFLRSVGIGDMKDATFYGLSLVLGGVEVRIDEMAKLYAMLARGGDLQDLQFRKRALAEPKAVLSDSASRLILEMLSENPRPSRLFDSTHTTAKIAIPWKTGTSFSFRDAWAVGIVGRYVLVVWVGNFNGRPNAAFVGRDAAGPLFFGIADALASDEQLYEMWRTGGRIKKVQICAVSGELPGPYCKHLKSSWYIPGVSPIHTCGLHRKVFIDTARAVRTCDASEHRGSEEVLEFWDSDLLQLYKEAGLPRREPPPLAPECGGVQITGKIPLITSPDPHIEYVLHGTKDKIPLTAVIDADSKNAFWFADGAFIGKVESGAPLFWEASEGTSMVRVVDEQGRSNEVQVSVVQAH